VSRFIISGFLILLSLQSSAQPYWQQEADHTIRVTLNPQEKTLDGFESIQYSNHSPDTIGYIWFHCWPNAYKNDRTAFSEQLLALGRTDYYFSDDESKGYINRLDFSVDGKRAEIADHPIHQDIIKLILPQPIPPGGSVIIETPFHVKLPRYFSRSGYSREDFAITQWFPKPAVYDRDGWHEMPYLDQGEFYSEYGKYDVRITAPSTYVIAATGRLVDSLLQDTLTTWHYREEKIHDFAFFASRDYVVDRDSLKWNDRIIKVFSYHRKSSASWQGSTALIKKAILSKSNWIGEYPYSTVKAVENPFITGGGMEYPTITLIGKTDNPWELESLITHETGHNWLWNTGLQRKKIPLDG
jgi:hypothetical protein